MRVLHAAAECLGFASTGGLGDVVAALPASQAAVGHDVRILLPRYGFLDARLRQGPVIEELDLGNGRRARFLQSQVKASGVPVILCEVDDAFDAGADPYRDAAGLELHDLVWRYALFSEAVATFGACSRIFAPQIVHLHDWHTALAASWLRQWNWRGGCVLSIHNLAFQGHCDPETMARTGLPPDLTEQARLDQRPCYSFMKAGILASDGVITVSHGYAREILTPERGCGLHEALQTRAAAGALHGIVNGIDDQSWNPQTDPALVQTYGLADIAVGKARNRAALTDELQLVPQAGPMVAFVGRLTEQKGADLIAAAGSRLFELRAQYVIVGVGDAGIAAQLAELAARAHRRLAFCEVFDAALARRVIAAADLLLMPSRFEPCGMTQMYALRYGTLPVVTRTGGLPDTVVDAQAQSLRDGSANGVLFNDADVGGLLYGLHRGAQLWGDARTRQALQRQGMRQPLCWGAAAQAYGRVYASLLRDSADGISQDGMNSLCFSLATEPVAHR